MLVSATVLDLRVEANVDPRKVAQLVCAGLSFSAYLGRSPRVRVRPLDEEARALEWPMKDDDGPFIEFETTKQITFKVV